MSTEANSGSVVETSAGTPAATTGAVAEGSTAATTDPFSGLETGTRTWVEKKGYKSVGDLATAALNAESLIGRSVQLPGDDAKPEDIDKFLAKATEKFRPKDANGYEFKLPESVPKDMPYDGEFAKAFKAEAHKAGLTSKQAAAAHDFYVAAQAKAWGDARVAEEDRQTKATAALEAKWGKPDSDTFKQASAMAVRAIDGLDIGKALADSGVFVRDEKGGLVVRNAEIALALEKVGRAMFKEDALVQGDNKSVAADNPFKDGFGKGNQTAQYQAIRANKQNAMSLIRQAGHDPAAWGLKD